MADKKITALTDLGDSLAAADLFHVVDDPSGTPINKKISAENVVNNIPSYIGLSQASQAITADASSQVADVTSAITEINATSATGAISLADGSDAFTIARCEGKVLEFFSFCRTNYTSLGHRNPTY